MNINMLNVDLSILKGVDLMPNYADLARKHDCDYRTIKRYANGYIRPKTHTKKSVLDPFVDVIKDKLSIPGTNIQAVYQFIISNNSIKCSYTNFRYFVVRHNLFDKKINATVRFETAYGKQAQVDWKEDVSIILKSGEVITFNVFAYILSNSRFVYHEFARFKDKDTLINCLINAFFATGGIPEDLLFDNMRTVVNIYGNGKRNINNYMKQFAKDFNFKIKLCRPYRCQTKGKVESSNKFIDWIKPYNNELTCVDEIIDKIKKINQQMNSRIHPTIGISPNLALQKEKEYLNPLPHQVVINSYLPKSIESLVHIDCLVNYKGKKYSVPADYVNKRVKLVEQDNQLHIYYNSILLAIHQITDKLINYKKDHYNQGYIAATGKYETSMDTRIQENLDMFDNLFKNKGEK